MTESSEGESERKAGLDRSRDRGAYAVEEEISKRISLPSLSRIKLRPDTFGVASAKFGIARQLSILNFSRLFPTTAIYLFYLFTRLSTVTFFSKFI